MHPHTHADYRVLSVHSSLSESDIKSASVQVPLTKLVHDCFEVHNHLRCKRFREVISQEEILSDRARSLHSVSTYGRKNQV